MTETAHEAAMRAARALNENGWLLIVGHDEYGAELDETPQLNIIASLILAHTGLAECVEALSLIAAKDEGFTAMHDMAETAAAALALVRQGPEMEGSDVT